MSITLSNIEECHTESWGATPDESEELDDWSARFVSGVVEVDMVVVLPRWLKV